MYLIITSPRGIMILSEHCSKCSPSFDCAALERANPKMVCKYICVAQPYLCLESVLENTLNTSAAKASVTAVPRASEVNDVVNHIMGILILISRLCANLLCYTRATGVEVGVLAHFQRLTAAGAGSRDELRGRTLLPAPAELQMEEPTGDPGQGSPQLALASPSTSISLAPPGSCSHCASSPAKQSQSDTSACG